MCLSPTRARYVPGEGTPTPDPEGNIQIPCGKCHECLTKRACEWALRAQHEISLHTESSFITLTYSEDELPSHLIVKDYFQKFMKRLRKRIPHKKIKYMVAHEYGTSKLRPHHHVLIFGYNPPKQEYLRTTPKGYPLFKSESISTIWEHGFHSIGEANGRTAYYTAGYALKGKKHTIRDPHTGELLDVEDTMNSSNGIGLSYLLKNADQLVNSGEPLPRYYKKMMEEDNQKKLIKRFPEHIDKILELPILLEQHQNDVAIKNHSRSAHEIYAKHIISKQEQSLYSGEFRSAPELTPSDKIFEEHLRHNRNQYVAKEKS